MSLFNSIKRYTAQIDEAKAKLAEINSQIQEAENKKRSVEVELNSIQNRLDAINVYIDLGQTYIPAQSLDELEQQRADLQDEIVNALGSGLWKIEQPVTFNDSISKGKALQKAHGDGLMYSMTAYIDSKEKSVNLSNYEESKRLIEKKFNQLQKKATTIGISLNKNYVAKRIEMLKLKAQIKEVNKMRKEQERKERERLREEQKLLEEAEKERKRLKAEKEAMDIAFARALSEAERAEIKSKLANIDLRLADIDYRINHPKAGYLYIISSPSLPDMVKIGVTRRLNPSIRVKELSSSSLPFPFELNAYCFNNDAFELELNMHNYFDAYRVSPNREFFYVPIEQAIDVLKNNFNQEVHYGTYEENNESEDDE